MTVMAVFLVLAATQMLSGNCDALPESTCDCTHGETKLLSKESLYVLNKAEP
jgi:hypothetical protein